MEIEIPNTDYRLKPGMYARISLTVEERKNTLVAPKNAVIDFENKRGVWMPNDDRRAQFVPVTLGIESPDQVEILAGLKEGDRFVTTGAAAVRNNDQLIIAGEGGAGGPGGRAAAARAARVAAARVATARASPGGGGQPARRRGRPAAAATAHRKRRLQLSTVQLSTCRLSRVSL